MGGSIDNGTGSGLQSVWPVDDARRANAAFELILLVEAKGRVTSPGPGRGIGQGNITIRGLDVE